MLGVVAVHHSKMKAFNVVRCAALLILVLGMASMGAAGEIDLSDLEWEEDDFFGWHFLGVQVEVDEEKQRLEVINRDTEYWGSPETVDGLLVVDTATDEVVGSKDLDGVESGENYVIEDVIFEPDTSYWIVYESDDPGDGSSAWPYTDSLYSEDDSATPIENDDARVLSGAGDNNGPDVSEIDSYFRIFNWDTIIIGINEPPVFESVSVDPSPPQIGENVSYFANLTDPDDDSELEEVELELVYGGETVYTDTRSVSGDSDSAEWLDVFVPEQTNEWLNATFEATNTAGVSTQEELNYFLDDTPPEVTIVEPGNQTYWSYDVPYEVEVDSDNDSVPGQEFDLELYSDGQLVETLEGTGTETFTGTFSQDLGENILFEASASDSGGTTNESVNFSVNDVEITDISYSNNVFETEDSTYTTSFDTGSMVESIGYRLEYQGDVESANVNVSGVTSSTESLSYRPRLVSESEETRVFDLVLDYERETVDGGTVSESVSSSEEQIVEEGFSPDGLSLDFDFDQSSRTIERHPFDVELDYSDSGLSESEIVVGGEASFQDSVFNGLSGSFTPGNVEGSEEFDVNADLIIEFKDDEQVREFNSETVTVDEVVLNTDAEGDPVLSIDLIDEETNDNVESDVEFNFDTTTSEGVLDKNFGFEEDLVESFDVYLDPGYASVLVDGVIRYSGDGYRTRRYEVRGQEVSSPALDLDLYLIDDVVGEPVYFEVVDAAGDGVSGILETQRYSESSNSFRTVSRASIDDGESLAYLNIDDVYYRHQVRDDDGEVLRVFDRRLITCSTIPCERVLQISDDVIPFEDQRRGFDFTCDTLTDSEGGFKGVQCDVSHEDDIMQGADLKLERSRGIGSTTVCESSVSSPGQLICELDEEDDVDGFRYSYSLTGYTNQFSYVLERGNFDFTENLFQGQAPFLAVITFVSIAFLGLRNYGTAVMFSVAGIFVSFALGLLQVGAASVAGLFIVGLFYIFLHSSA